jgi:hypothetical protein
LRSTAVSNFPNNMVSRKHSIVQFYDKPSSVLHNVELLDPCLDGYYWQLVAH